MKEIVTTTYDDIALVRHGEHVPGARSVRIGWEGQWWTIDLAAENEETLWGWLDENVLSIATPETVEPACPVITAEPVAEEIKPELTTNEVERYKLADTIIANGKSRPRRRRLKTREYYAELRAWAARAGIEIKQSSGSTYLYPKHVVEQFEALTGNVLADR